MKDEINTRYTLIQRACDLKDERAWEELIGHYRRFIFYILQQIGVVAGDIDDVAQQVMVALTKNLPNYDSSRARFRSWLSGMIRNIALAHFRKLKNDRDRIHGFGEKQQLETFEQPSEIDRRIETEWASYVSTLAMNRVKKVFQGQAIEVFELGLDGYSATDIAAKTDLTVSSVYTLRKRVKKRLCLEVLALVAELEPS